MNNKKKPILENGRIKRSIIRWAGGKTWLLKELRNILPQEYNNYHEPFLGGGSVYYYLNPPGKSFLSDTNKVLINSFLQIRDNVEEVISTLRRYNNTKEDYYKIRKIKYTDPAKQAAQFFYLNRTGYNGIYRVNFKGQYNVPYGYKNYKILYHFDRYRKASKQLQAANLYVDDFETSLDNVKENDLVFLDPPYTASYTINGFIKYNEKLFSWEDQARLADFLMEIKKKKAFYILTNAKHKDVYKLFSKINKPITMKRACLVGGKQAKRGIVEEYVFTNTIPL